MAAHDCALLSTQDVWSHTHLYICIHTCGLTPKHIAMLKTTNKTTGPTHNIWGVTALMDLTQKTSQKKKKWTWGTAWGGFGSSLVFPEGKLRQLTPELPRALLCSLQITWPHELFSFNAYLETLRWVGNMVEGKGCKEEMSVYSFQEPVNILPMAKRTLQMWLN